MPEPRSYQTEAIIIKKIKLGEADRILTLYTPDRGKVEAVAKGVRRPKSKMAGHLELLTYSQIRLARGRNLDTIIGSQTLDSFMPLKEDLWLTSLGLYLRWCMPPILRCFSFCWKLFVTCPGLTIPN